MLLGGILMKAVLLLHGFLTDSDDFKNIFPGLESRYDYVCKLTFPGHGVNEDYIDFEVDNTFSCMLNAFDELKDKYETIDVIGFSMGGALATYLSNVREFNKLVLLAPANKFFNLRMPTNKLKYMFLSLFGKNKLNTSLDVKDMYIDDVKSLNMGMKRLIPNYNVHTLFTFIRIINKCNKECKEIKNPTLIVWGKLDQFVPIKSAQFDYELCTNKEKKLVILDSISHLMLSSSYNKHIISSIFDFLDN